jgi:acetyl-CoA decarbonylase/synthase complex subunit gamma
MMAGLVLIITGSAYLGMNFTGASTYTSLSGVRKEMRWALPLEVGGAALALVLWVISLVNG